MSNTLTVKISKSCPLPVSLRHTKWSGRRESNPHGQLGSSVLYPQADLRIADQRVEWLLCRDSPLFPATACLIWHGSGTRRPKGCTSPLRYSCRRHCAMCLPNGAKWSSQRHGFAQSCCYGRYLIHRPHSVRACVAEYASKQVFQGNALRAPRAGPACRSAHGDPPFLDMRRIPVPVGR